MNSWLATLALLVAAGGLAVSCSLWLIARDQARLIEALSRRIKALEREPFSPRPPLPLDNLKDAGVELPADQDDMEAWAQEMEAAGHRVTPEEIQIQREMRLAEGM